jgi:FkbM family methyltransferase
MEFKAYVLTSIMAANKILHNCFNIHKFDELNNCDYNTLCESILFFKSKYPNKTNTIFFDIGCNAGSFVKALASFNIKSNIYCFEPHPVLSKKVKETYPYINMESFCIGNTNSEVIINIPEFSVGLSSLIDRPVFNELKQNIVRYSTQCKMLDSYCNEQHIDCIDFIKIDVEGAEKMVFEGASNMLRSHKIISGVFEVGQTLIDAGTNFNEIKSMLEGYGYSVIPASNGNDYIFFLQPDN